MYVAGKEQEKLVCAVSSRQHMESLRCSIVQKVICNWSLINGVIDSLTKMMLYLLIGK